MPSAHNSAFCDPGRCLSTFLVLTQHWPVLAPTVDCGLPAGGLSGLYQLGRGIITATFSTPSYLTCSTSQLKCPGKDLTGVMPPVSSLLILKCDKAVVCNVADMIIPKQAIDGWAGGCVVVQCETGARLGLGCGQWAARPR